MRREDESVFLVDFTCRRDLNLKKVVVRLLDCSSHTRSLDVGSFRRHVANREIGSMGATEHRRTDRDAR